MKGLHSGISGCKTAGTKLQKPGLRGWVVVVHMVLSVVDESHCA